MKLLLDENLPERLKQDLRDHVVSTVEEEGWRSIQNGELLRVMIASGFEALITRDRKMQYQQNLRKYPIPIFGLRAKEINAEAPFYFASRINRLLKGRLKPGAHELFFNP